MLAPLSGLQSQNSDHFSRNKMQRTFFYLTLLAPQPFKLITFYTLILFSLNLYFVILILFYMLISIVQFLMLKQTNDHFYILFQEFWFYKFKTGLLPHHIVLIENEIQKKKKTELLVTKLAKLSKWNYSNLRTSCLETKRLKHQSNNDWHRESIIVAVVVYSSSRNNNITFFFFLLFEAESASVLRSVSNIIRSWITASVVVLLLVYIFLCLSIRMRRSRMDLQSAEI